MYTVALTSNFHPARKSNRGVERKQ